MVSELDTIGTVNDMLEGLELESEHESRSQNKRKAKKAKFKPKV